MTTEPQNTPLAETKRTATPWTIAQYGDITGAGGEVLLLPGVALPCGSHSRRPEADANREFIVRACNAHDVMVAAIVKLKKLIAENHPNNWTEYDMLCAGSAIDAALAKANGGAL